MGEAYATPLRNHHSFPERVSDGPACFRPAEAVRIAAMRISRQRREVARGRWLSAALAVALVAAQGASLAHFAIVKHAICPLHGELIHPGSEAHRSAKAHATRPPGPALFGSDQDGNAAQHDHCAVVGHRREVALPSVSSALLRHDVRPVTTPRTLAWAPTSDVRHRLAPKQSPPV